MKLNALRDLYLDDLRGVYDAEQETVKSLPKLMAAASSPELRSELSRHLEQTKAHVSRLEQIFGKLGQKPKTEKCESVRAILGAAEHRISGKGNPAVLDAGLIAEIQRLEHFEIAAYGALKSWAVRCSDEQSVQMLTDTLREEKEADSKLTAIAEAGVNAKAEGTPAAAA